MKNMKIKFWSNGDSIRKAKWFNSKAKLVMALAAIFVCTATVFLIIGLIVVGPIFSQSQGLNGGHVSMGATAPAPTFYFAEGSCRPGINSYLCIQNPGDTAAIVKITYMKADKTTYEQPEFTVDAKSRKTITVVDSLYQGVHANDDAHDFSAKVECINGQNIVAERSVYFKFSGIDGGHNIVGATSPAQAFYFAEGSCRPGVDSFLCIQNPGNDAAIVKITYMKGDGGTYEQSEFTVDAKSRKTVSVVNELYGGVHANDDTHDFSCKVESISGGLILVERPMYFNFPEPVQPVSIDQNQLNLKRAVAKIDIYFAHRHSPMELTGSAFVQEWQATGIDPFLGPAIAEAESTCGLACFAPFNFWGGLAYPGGFSSWEQSVSTQYQWILTHHGVAQTSYDLSGYCIPDHPWMEHVESTRLYIYSIDPGF